MRTTWLHQVSKGKLLVFFSGWGIDCRPFSHLDSDEYDVMFVDRYVDLDFGEIPSIVSGYDHRVIIGWSMGVWVVSRMMKALQVKADLVAAINGTVLPIHAEYGIAPLWFKATIDQFDQQVLEKFYRRMCRNKSNLKSFLENQPYRSLESLKEELVFLYNEGMKETVKQDGTTVCSSVVSMGDVVFPAANQIRAWEDTGSKIVEMKGSHFCFHEADSWDEVVALVKKD